MASTASSLQNRGLISGKQMAKLKVLRGTRPQKSKMAAFNSSTKDEGNTRGQGQYSAGQINSGATQDRSKMSTGSKAGAESQPIKTNQINTNGKKSVYGSNVSASHKGSNTRSKGPIAAQGGLYGGGGRNTQ